MILKPSCPEHKATGEGGRDPQPSAHDVSSGSPRRHLSRVTEVPSTGSSRTRPACRASAASPDAGGRSALGGNAREAGLVDHGLLVQHDREDFAADRDDEVIPFARRLVRAAASGLRRRGSRAPACRPCDSRRSRPTPRASTISSPGSSERPEERSAVAGVHHLLRPDRPRSRPVRMTEASFSTGVPGKRQSALRMKFA